MLCLPIDTVEAFFVDTMFAKILHTVKNYEIWMNFCNVSNFNNIFTDIGNQ